MSQKNTITTADAFEQDEFKRFLDCLHKDKKYNFEAFCRLAFCTACRGGDVLNLRWIDVLDKQQLTIIEQKTGKVRSIPFNTNTRNALKNLWEKSGKPSKADYIMAAKLSDKPVSIQYLNRELKAMKVKYKLQIGNISTHSFRKTFGRYVYDTSDHSTESLFLLNRILKHSDIKTTMVYLGITQKEINKVYESINI